MAARNLTVLLLGKDQGGLGTLDTLKKKVDDTGKQTQSSSSIMTDALGGIAVAAGAFAMKSVAAFSDAGSEVMKMQRIVGGTPEEMSRLRNAVKMSGVDVDAFTKATGMLEKKLGASKDTMKDFGIATLDAQGNARPMTDVIGDIADKFTHATSPIERTKLATSLFGRSWQEVAPFLAKGRDGIEALMKSTNKNLILSQAQIDEVKKNKMAQRELSAAFEGLQIRIGSGVMPVLTTLTNGLAAIPGPIMDVAAPVTGLGIAMLGTVVAGKKVWDTLSPAVGKLKEWNSSLKGTEEGGMGANLKMGALAAGIGLVVAGIVKMQNDSKETQSTIFKGLDFSDLEAANSKLNQTGETINAMGAKWDGYSNAERLAHAEEYKLWQDASAQQEEHRAHLNAAIDDTHRLADALGISAKAAEELLTEAKVDPTTASFDKLVEVMGKYKDKSITTAEAQRDLAGATNETTDAIQSESDILKGVLDPLFAAEAALTKNTRAERDSKRAKVELSQAQKFANEQIAIWGPNSAQARDATEKLQQAMDKEHDSTISAAQSAFDLTSKMAALKKGVEDGSIPLKKSREALDSWVAQGYLTAPEADSVANSFLGVANQATNASNAVNNFAGATQQAQAIMAAHGPYTIPSGPLSLFGPPKANAAGGWLSEGWNTAGEGSATELMFKSGANVRVFNHGDSARIAGGGGGGGVPNVHIHFAGAPLIGEREIALLVQQALLQLQRTSNGPVLG